MSFLRSIEEIGYKARAERRFLTGTVVDVDLLQHTCSLDVGASDAQGNPVYLTNIPFNPATPPALGAQVSLLYGNSNPHSMVVPASPLGGGNAQTSITVRGAVNSLAVQGQAALQGSVVLVPGANVTLAESGQNITISAAGGSGTPASTVQPVGQNGVVGTSTNYAREDHQHAGVHSLAASGQPQLTGDVVLAAGANITLQQNANSIIVSAGGSGGGSTAYANTIEVVNTQGGGGAVVSQGNSLWIIVIGSVQSYTLALSGTAPICWVYNNTANPLSIYPGSLSSFANGQSSQQIPTGASGVFVGTPNGTGGFLIYRMM